LEILADFQVTIPELGTIEAVSIPTVILTSNGTRALSDALRRRCLYSYIDFPDEAREREIIKRRLPCVEQELAEQIARFVQCLRKEELEKTPGIAETLDWAAALIGLEIRTLDCDPEILRTTLICLLKTETDQATISKEVVSRRAGQAA